MLNVIFFSWKWHRKTPVNQKFVLGLLPTMHWLNDLFPKFPLDSFLSVKNNIFSLISQWFFYAKKAQVHGHWWKYAGFDV
jgi:hypothetical protein